MSVAHHDHPMDVKPSLVPQYDDAMSDISMASSVHGPDSFNGRFSPTTESDRQSINSYASTIDREFILKDVHGRIVNSTNEFYLLPADVDEHGRLDIQHQMLKAKMGGLYSGAQHVRRILAPRPEGMEAPAVLDIGTGSGSWALDMAEEFPHAEVVGIDLVPANVSVTVPPNCRFECDDVNQGLTHYKNCFDVIHMRFEYKCTFQCSGRVANPISLLGVTQGIADCPAFFYEVYDLLRPGGILLVVEGNSMHGENCKMLTQEDENAPDFSWMAKMTRTMFNIIKERAAAVAPGKAASAGAMAPRLYQGWMKEMKIWQAQDHQKFLVAMGPWKQGMNGRERYASELLRQNFFRLCASWRPAFLNYGIPAETVDDWIARAQDEIVHMRAHTYVGWQASWALKPKVPINDMPGPIQRP